MNVDEAIDTWRKFRDTLGKSINVEIPKPAWKCMERDIGGRGWREMPVGSESKLGLYFYWMCKLKMITEASIDIHSPSTSVVDIGCGSGMFASLVDTDNYLGVDLVPNNITYCKSSFPDKTFEHLDIHNGTYNTQGAIDAMDFQIPKPDASIDFIMCNSLFTHIGLPKVIERYLDEMDRALVTGGYAYTTWFRSPPNEVYAGTERTVYKESQIEEWLSRWEVISEMGGDTGNHDDQWEVLCRKNASG